MEQSKQAPRYECEREAFKQGLDDGQMKLPFKPRPDDVHPWIARNLTADQVNLFENAYLIGYVKGREIDVVVGLEYGIRVRIDDEQEYSHER